MLEALCQFYYADSEPQELSHDIWHLLCPNMGQNLTTGALGGVKVLYRLC